MAPTSVAVNQDFKETGNRIAMVRKAFMAMNSLFQKFGFFLEKEILRKKFLFSKLIAASRKKLAITSVFANKDFMDMEQKAEQVRKNLEK